MQRNVSETINQDLSKSLAEALENLELKISSRMDPFIAQVNDAR